MENPDGSRAILAISGGKVLQQLFVKTIGGKIPERDMQVWREYYAKEYPRAEVFVSGRLYKVPRGSE